MFSILFFLFVAAFDDDEDDIMIVEEKDALDIPDQASRAYIDQAHHQYVAEVIVDETSNDHVNDERNGEGVNDTDHFNHFDEIICVSPSQYNQNLITTEQESSSYKDNKLSGLNLPACKSHDNNGNEKTNTAVESNTTISTTAAQCVTTTTIDESEPIYLSDSLSCFDSDSDSGTQQEDLDEMIKQHKVETRKTNDHQPAMQRDQQSNTIDENDEMDALNLSTDDVIIVQPEYIESIDVDRSDSDDERFASKYAFEPFIESDSQLTSDIVSAGRDDSEHVDERLEMARQFGAASVTAVVTSSFDETTTDGDDDSSEMDRRGIRSRRDNMVRKNYSIRRTYARRKLKSDTESPVSNELINPEAKNENCSNDNELKSDSSPLHSHRIDGRVNSHTVENEMKIKLIHGNNTVDGTDDENSINVTVTKSVRTYVRKKGAISKLTSCNSKQKSPLANTIELIESSDTQSENTTNSCNDAEAKPAQTSVALNSVRRKRGRPRKNPIIIANNTLDGDEPKSCETIENIATTSPLLVIQQLNSEQPETEIQIQTDEINGPTMEIFRQVPNIAPKFQKSNKLNSKNQRMASKAETSSITDVERQDIHCMDEIKLEASSTQESTISVQQLHENDENAMEIEIGETVVEESTDQESTNPDDQLCEKSRRTEITILGTDCRSSESKPAIGRLFALIFFY